MRETAFTKLDFRHHRLSRSALLAFGLAVGLSASAYAAPQGGDLGHWTFENGVSGATAAGTGSVLDSSGLANHGTPAGDPTYVPGSATLCGQGIGSIGMSFDGQGDEVEIPSLFPFHGPGDATLEFRIRFQASGHQSVLWTRSGNSDSNRYNIFVNRNGTFGFDYRTPSGSLRRLVGSSGSGVPLPQNTWCHVAIVRKGDTYETYVNGSLRATATDVSPALPTSTGWQLAGRSGYQFRGSLDDIRLSSRALSPREFAHGAPATESFRFGIPANPDAFRPGVTTSPRVGATWDPLLDHSSFAPSAIVDFVAISIQGSANLPSASGTVLIATPLASTFFNPSPGTPFAIPIPNDCAFVGISVWTQGGSVSAGPVIELANALDLMLGDI